MKMWQATIGAVAALVCAAPVLADPTSETLFKHKNWEVEGITYEDGSVACLAEVDAQTESFTVWLSAEQDVRLQFYSTAWDFGEGDTANLEVQIGNRTPWTLTEAELYKNSVLFNLPNSDEGVRFLVEVAQGSRLYLRAEDGSSVQDYSLSGSQASINALIECGDAIKSKTNPFN